MALTWLTDPLLWNCNITLVSRRCCQYRPSESDWRTRRWIGPISFWRRTVSSSSGSRFFRELVLFFAACQVPDDQFARRDEEHHPHYVLYRERVQKQLRVPIQ